MSVDIKAKMQEIQAREITRLARMTGRSEEEIYSLAKDLLQRASDAKDEILAYAAEKNMSAEETEQYMKDHWSEFLNKKKK